MQCTNTPYKLSQLHLCRMEQLPNGTVALNISLDVRPVLNYLEITAKLFYKYTTYRPFMIDWSIELCQAYRMGGINPSSALVLKIIETTVPNIYYACPHGNRSYSVLWYFNPKFIPDKLPSGDYRLDIVFRDTSNTVLISMQMYAAMRKQGLIG
uniref:Uncharacterized protein n=1 Tax=Anopheles arabiensis TaxID=7173 RepID=A0A2C9GP98_ANOAR